MSKRDKPSAHSEPGEPIVKLKPILAIRPGIYLTVIYGLVLALLVFFFLFYPGLRNRGSYVSVSVSPGKASVMVDGTFAGTAPCTVFVKQGRRKIEVDKAFYAAVSRDVDIHGRVFATLFVPQRRRLSFELTVSDLAGLIRNTLNDFAANPFIPRIISDAALAAYGARASSDHVDAQTRLYDLASDAALFVNPSLEASATTATSEMQLAELLRASSRIATYGTFFTPANYLSFVRKIIQVKENHDNSPAWLLLSISREHAKTLASSQWISRHFSDYRDKISQYYQANLGVTSAGGGAASVLGGTVFRSIPKGVLIMGKDDNLDALGKSVDLLLPHPVPIEAFFLSETETTNRQFEAFVSAVPQWRPSNRDALAAQGLASDAYLSDWVNDRPPAGREEFPVAYVSHDAASAYCDWLTPRVRASVPGYEARLPNEAEWEWAARGGLKGMPYPLGEKPGNAVFFAKGITGPSRAGSSEPNGYGLRDMMGNLWEWCQDSFGQSDYLLSSLDPQKNVSFMLTHPVTHDKVVRGGGWNIQNDLVKVYSRGSQPEDWCTPFLGFRVAVALHG